MTLDRPGFESFFITTRVPLLAYLTRRVPTEDAADLLAEVYLIAWRRRTDLPPGDDGRLWLYGVARRLVLSHHRAVDHSVPAEAVAEVARESPGSEEDGTTRWRERAVQASLWSLNPLDRELVTLTTWERLSIADASRVMGITPGTGRVRLHRARARLARHPRLLQLVEGADPPDRHAPGQPALLSPKT